VIEIIVSGISLGISVVSCIGTAGIWVRYIRESRRVLSLVRVGEDGEVIVDVGGGRKTQLSQKNLPFILGLFLKKLF